MKNSEFIRGIMRGDISAPTSRNRSGYKECSNVLYDGQHVYSYGSHYPLLIQLETADGTKWILNDRGYSSSTGRHISYARGFQDASVKIDGRQWRATSPEKIMEAIDAERVQLAEYIAITREKIAKRPRYTSVYDRGIADAEARGRNLDKAEEIARAAIAYQANTAASA